MTGKKDIFVKLPFGHMEIDGQRGAVIDSSLCSTDWLTDCLTDCMTDCLTDCLTDEWQLTGGIGI
jgi:hypothetical protein